MSKRILLYNYISFIRFYLIFHLKFQYINSIALDEEKYPVSHVMSNGDIFMITDKRALVLDSSLGSIKKYHNFETSIIIDTEEKAARTTISQFPNDYIIALYNDILFVYSSIGEYIYEDNLSSYLGGSYYSLIPYKKDSDNNYDYYYIIAFFRNATLNIQYYKLSMMGSQKQNNKLSEKTINQ